jgi:tRNA dimethylallyltransferase
VPCSIIYKEDQIEQIFLSTIREQEQKIPPEVNLRRKRAIILAGPTGTGKSAMAMMMAQAMGGEIISADSMQVYRGMDIGTAKPSKAEQELIPHHLIDIRNVTESFNVVDFYYQAKHICQQIHARDNVPIFVGGSGFYVHSLIYGPPSGPPSVPDLRKDLEESMDKLGPDFMYEKLKKMDPQYAATITKHDRHKIVRALEIISLTGKRVSKYTWKNRKHSPNIDFRCWFLHRPRANLYHRIEKRCDKMIEAGLIDEVRRLDQEGIRKNSTASQAIGYRQTLQYLDSPQTKDDYRYYVDEFKKATRHYAKRQFTWFRREPLFRWIDLDLHDPETAMEIIMQDYETYNWE